MLIHDDTIAAIATAPGEAGVSITRVSGPKAFAIAETLFDGKTRPSEMAGNSFAYGRFHAADEDKATLDEVILLAYRAPHSYTRDDVVEIQSHGGSVSARRILRAVLEAGARMAEPGEFTRRAFLNGRLDLLQAEAVADLIRARSDRAAGAAVEQLTGSLSDAFNQIYDNLITVAADIEATLDFAEEELPEETLPALSARLRDVVLALEDLLATWEEGHLLRDGALVVISGQPNVGKSTLMNALLGKSRAIVTDMAGTTRDTIEEHLVVDGVPLRLVDTAGIRDVDCVIEKEGIRRARASMQSADINIHMLDASQALDTQDADMLQRLEPQRTIIVLNKSDLGNRVDTDALPPDMARCHCALRSGEGLQPLTDALAAHLHVQHNAPPHAVISERHRDLVRSALGDTKSALQQLEEGGGDAPILTSQAMREALETLGTVTGRAYSEALLDTVFSRFCIGK
jgi:tRNA modification GTPase